MSFLQTIFRKTTTPSNSRWYSDLIKDEGINLFHSAQEAVQAYRANFEIFKRREIALQIEQTLKAFLDYKYSQEEINFLTELLIRNNKRFEKVKSQDQSSFNYLNKLDPIGITLLEIPKDVNVQSLKKLYRKASMKYHPDIGGSHEKMIKINESYSLFHNALINFIPFEENKELKRKFQSNPGSWYEWLCAVNLVLSCINGDFLATDKAFPYLKEAHKIATKCKSRYIADFANDLSGMGGVLDSTCTALSRFKMREELEEAALIISYFFDLIIQNWIPADKYDLRPEREDYPSKQDFTSQLGIKLVLNHPEKARNAFRLGKIDKSRFETTMERFNLKISDEKAICGRIDKFISEIGFLQKLSNADCDINVSNPQIINTPNYFQERFDHLTDNQKWEYLKTFSPEGSGELFMKYSSIRTQEILLGLIQNYNSLDKKLLEIEINFFCDHYPEIFDKYLIVSEILNHLKEIDEKERCSKLLLLNQLDDPEPRSFEMTISISLDNFDNNSYSKRISVNDDYVEFMKMSLNEINQYKDSGHISSGYHIAWNRDLKSLETFNESDIGKFRQEVWLERKNPSPEEIIESCKPYIEGLLELGKAFHSKNTGELQIGYEINRLTTAYGKLKQWDKVVYWGVLFSNLPRHYRERSSDGEKTKIRKRVDRAKKYTGKFDAA